MGQPIPDWLAGSMISPLALTYFWHLWDSALDLLRLLLTLLPPHLARASTS